MDARIDKIEQTLIAHQAGLDRLQETSAKAVDLARLEGKVETFIADSDKKFASIEMVEKLRADVRGWMFGAALTIMLGLGSLQFALFAQMTNTMERRFERIEQRMDRLEQRMDVLEQRMEKLEQRVEKLEQRVEKLEQRVESLERKVDDLSKRVK
jgi:DNA repair exonuclease SbcCD ATPase subunit